MLFSGLERDGAGLRKRGSKKKKGGAGGGGNVDEKKANSRKKVNKKTRHSVAGFKPKSIDSAHDSCSRKHNVTINGVASD